MPSLETLRRTILLTLYDNRALLVGVDDSANRRELAGILTDAVAIHIATEATLETFADVPVPTEETEPVRGAQPKASTRLAEFVAEQRTSFETLPGFEMPMPGRRLESRLKDPDPFLVDHNPTPTDGGIGARHVGRPWQTVADADTCAACHEAKTSCPRLFFPSALGRPGGGKWLIENVLCLRGAHRRAALRWILNSRGEL